MNQSLIAASVLALLLAGCAATPEPQAQATPDAQPTLSAEASAALVAAQADVKNAKAKDALWTTAESALKAAEEAAAKGDSATVIVQAKRASLDVQRGLAQLDYPPVKIGD